MQVYSIIEQAQAGHAMDNLAQAFGITEQQARTVAQTVLPELAWSLERNTLSRGGLADLLQALGQGHHEQILDTPRAWTDQRVTADGQAILAHILGAEHKSRALAARAAQASGLGEGIIQMLLPILAQLLMGAIARYAKGGLGDILSKLPIPGGGGGASQSGGSDGNRGNFPGGGGFELPRSDLPPAGGYPMPPIPSSPDGTPGRNGGFEMPWPSKTRTQPEATQSNPDFRTGGGFGLPRTELPPAGGFPMPPMPPSPDGAESSEIPRNNGAGQPFPLPGPGDNNPYGDLSDILRRGGSAAGSNAAVGGGGLWRLARGVIGSVLGFGGRGIFGWLVQLVVMRWGWRFLQRILGRVLLGR